MLVTATIYIGNGFFFISIVTDAESTLWRTIKLHISTDLLNWENSRFLYDLLTKWILLAGRLQYIWWNKSNDCILIKAFLDLSQYIWKPQRCSNSVPVSCARCGGWWVRVAVMVRVMRCQSTQSPSDRHVECRHQPDITPRIQVRTASGRGNLDDRHKCT